jgi:hypothetical protein
MNYFALDRRLAAIVVTLAVAGTAACSNSSTPSGLGTQQLSVSADTVVGTGQLAELQVRRAAWVARGINNYRVELRISCFCGETIRRPVLVEVRGGAVSKVLDLETAKAVADITPYPTITQLFDRAIEMRAQNGHVSVAYDRALGYPARLEIGTIANDAGTLYYLGALTPLAN